MFTVIVASALRNRHREPVLAAEWLDSMTIWVEYLVHGRMDGVLGYSTDISLEEEEEL